MESLELMVIGGETPKEETFTDGKIQTISTQVPEKMTDDELLAHLGIDKSQWQVAKVKYSRQPVYRKAQESRHVRVGKDTVSWKNDTGGIRVEYTYGVQVWLTRKTEEIKATSIVEGILQRLEEKAPKVPKKSYRKGDDGLMLQVMLPDIHIGRSTHIYESGEDYNIELAFRVVHEAIESMLHKVQSEKIEKVLFLVGNDFFNVDNEHKTTAHGTPQQEEQDFAITFLAGERLLSYIVERLTEVAPLDLLFIPGNHDPHRLFYLGRVAQALYANNENVTVTNRLLERQYYMYGSNLFGFTHGDRININKLPAIMPLEVLKFHPDWWAKSRYREWHMGHFHTKRDMEYLAYDDIGVTLRFFRSLTAADRWNFQSGYVGSPKAAESLLWTPHDGLYGQFPATIRSEVYIQ